VSRITLITLVLASIAGTASAQVHPPENVQLLAHVDRGEGYSGNWGYTAPNGVELAISGTVSGTTFIDATVPTAAHEVAFIPGPGSIWREMAIWSHYCYIVTEAAGAGLQIVDLANPLAPTLVATLNPPALPYTTAHEIKIDQQTGRCYVAGTRNGTTQTGLIILDLNVNPVSPVQIGAWPQVYNGTEDYTHDLSILNGKAYIASIYQGIVYVLDVTQLPIPPIVGQWTYPTAFTHNTWPTADGSYLVTTDENTGGHLRMWDIRNLSLPVQTDEFISPTGALVHNAYIRGRYCFMSHYKDGLRVVDVADPSNIVPVGWYDTHPQDGGSTIGAWGCYCFATDPYIAYISDRDTGTYILRFNPPGAAVADPAGASPVAPALLGNFPNPFRPSTAIRFELAGAGQVSLRVYDTSGRVVRVLVDRPLAAGAQSALWDGRDDARRPAASGVYYYCLETPGFSGAGSMVLAR
jgi:choice-of-anchor B domain-containing protein